MDGEDHYGAEFEMQGRTVLIQPHKLGSPSSTLGPATTLTGRGGSSGHPACPNPLASRPVILPRAQCSSGGRFQSRPFPARTAKVMESAGQYMRNAAMPDGAPEREGVWQAASEVASGFDFSSSGRIDAELLGALDALRIHGRTAGEWIPLLQFRCRRWFGAGRWHRWASSTHFLPASASL